MANGSDSAHDAPTADAPAGSPAGTFRLAPIFSDHMVLQRHRPVPVWGEGPDGGTVEVRFAGQVRRGAVSEGRWEIVLDPLEAGGPHVLEVRCEGGPDDAPTVRLVDLLVGEVFLAGGQSNMEWPMQHAEGIGIETAYAFRPMIRCYDVPREFYPGAEWYEYGGEFRFFGWEICTPESVHRFSAVAYHFARTLESALGVPVGIVGCNFGATSASCWMGEAALAEDPDTRVYLEEYQAAIDAQGPGGYEANYEAYRRQLQEFREMRRPDGPWFPPHGSRSFLRPAGLYGTMLRKAAPFAARGVLWYQGESDVSHAGTYRKLLGRMIAEWRTLFRDPGLPFLLVQLASFAGGNPDGEDWAVLREAQGQVADEVPGVAMAVCLDFGDAADIHPRHKRPVGERLALCALRRIFGQGGEDSGPVPGSWVREGDRLLLSFSHAGYGLHQRGLALSGFSWKLTNGGTRPAEASLAGDRVAVVLPGEAEPAELRYGWSNVFVPTLYNGRGLPASPFRIRMGAGSEGMGTDREMPRI